MVTGIDKFRKSQAREVREMVFFRVFIIESIYGTWTQNVRLREVVDCLRGTLPDFRVSCHQWDFVTVLEQSDRSQSMDN